MAEHAIIEVDTSGVIVRWNHGAEVLIGHPPEAAVGRTLDLVVPPRLRDAHWAGFRSAMAQPQVRDLAADLPVLCADGEERHLAGRLLVLSDALGTAVGAMAILTDSGATGVRPFG